jgi:hypothetical protein
VIWWCLGICCVDAEWASVGLLLWQKLQKWSRINCFS